MANQTQRHRFFPTIKLNVGGQHFTTSLHTLNKDPNSMLATMFSGKFEMKPSEDGAFFIDRDGTHFRFILNYLRTGKLALPANAAHLEELEAEANFYQIQGLIDELKSKAPFQESQIVKEEDHRKLLKRWLPNQGVEWQLLFRASRDGFTAQAFHSRCDNKGPTVTIVKSGDNIFGGFTEISWTSHCNWVPCHESFLFSLVNPHGLGPIKIPEIKSKENAIFCNTNCGPTFGGWYNLHISRNANKTNSSYSNLSHSFNFLPDTDLSLTGCKYFSVTDYEVFRS